MIHDPKISRREAVVRLGAMSLLPIWAQPAPASVFGTGSSSRANVAGGTADSPQKILLDQSVVVTDAGEPSYVQYAVKELSDYLKDITGRAIPIRSSLDKKANSLIVVGKTSRQVLSAGLDSTYLGEEGFLIKSVVKDGAVQVVVAGANPKGTNHGLANLMKMIQAAGASAYLPGPLEIQSKPSLALRGIFPCGWVNAYPYAFRAWKEKDWQQYIDILWYQGVNLFLHWPFMEIMPVPLSRDDEVYLEEVRRLVDYAQKQRGMEVWIFHSANRVATSNCDSPDPRIRGYWVNQCQKDMNPADPQQFDKVMKSLEALYRALNNADGFCLGDADPGGWPQSLLSDEMKIFQGARALLDRYNVHGPQAKLIDWLWLGWGRHKYLSSNQTVVSQYDWTEQNPDASDVAFMEETIRTLRKDIPEPWWLLAGFPPYLKSSQEEKSLEKTVFCPYGAIEDEPSFPWTNVSLGKVHEALDVIGDYPGTSGLMGNNMTALLQLPRTYYFLASAWDYEYRNREERDVLLDLSRHVYPEHSALIVDCFLALEETDPEKISDILASLESVLNQGTMGRPGVIGRSLFPDQLQVANDLVFQLRIRAARQQLLKSLTSKASRNECEKLVENYLDVLLAWNQKTGWEKVIKVAIWRAPIYTTDKQFTEAMSILRRVLAGNPKVTSYAAIASFFEPIRQRLLRKYPEDAVMVGCIEPLKMAVIEAP